MASSAACSTCLLLSRPSVPTGWRMARADIGIVPAVELNRQKLEIIRGLRRRMPRRGSQHSVDLQSSVRRDSHACHRFDVAHFCRIEPDHPLAEIRRGAAALAAGAAHRQDAGKCGCGFDYRDTALLLDPATLPFHVLDLGKEWTEMTGLPMVFAVWAARAGVPKQDPKPFTDSLRFGQEHMDDIVREWYPKLGLSEALVREYLTRNIVFELGEREYAGLQTFLQYASELSTPTEATKVTV